MFDLITRNGHHDLFSLPRIVQQILDEAHPAPRPGIGLSVPVDVLETDAEVRLVLEVAGLDRESMKVTLQNNVLTLAGEKQRRTETPEGACFRGERRFGKFSRSFTLPTRVEADRIEARYSDGVLEVVCPKTPEARPRQIEIRSA